MLNLPPCHTKSPLHPAWVKRVEELETEGLTRSDAQGIADMEALCGTPKQQTATENSNMKNNKYTVIVQAPAVNEWTYEVLASSKEEAEKIITEGLEGDRELPDPIAFEQGNEVDGELVIAYSYKL